MPAGITRGPDGNIWFTESALPGTIGRVTVPPLADLELDADRATARATTSPTACSRRRSPPTRSPRPTLVEYGPDKQYGERTDERPAGTGAEPVDARSSSSRSRPSSHYHARLVATNGSGESVSGDVELWVDATAG